MVHAFWNRQSVTWAGGTHARVQTAVLAAAVAYLPSVALANDICRAVALRDVAAIEAPDSVIPRGDYDDAITQYNINKQTKTTTFCSHGGYCYPTHVYINGQKQEALRLVNCKVGIKAFEDAEQVTYSVDVDRSRNSAATLRESDVSQKLLDMGLCSACASNVTAFYVRKPTSACGRLARQALEGNPAAADKLREDPSYCHYAWDAPGSRAGVR